MAKVSQLSKNISVPLPILGGSWHSKRFRWESHKCGFLLEFESLWESAQISFACRPLLCETECPCRFVFFQPGETAWQTCMNAIEWRAQIGANPARNHSNHVQSNYRMAQNSEPNWWVDSRFPVLDKWRRFHSCWITFCILPSSLGPRHKSRLRDCFIHGPTLPVRVSLAIEFFCHTRLPWNRPKDLPSLVSRYSQLSLKRTPSGPKLLSSLERCPL